MINGNLSVDSLRKVLFCHFWTGVQNSLSIDDSLIILYALTLLEATGKGTNLVFCIL